MTAIGAKSVQKCGISVDDQTDQFDRTRSATPLTVS
jgi:hypothetical protein